MDTPDLFEDPLSEYCRSPSPAVSTTSSVVRTGIKGKRKIMESPQSMMPDFSNRRGDHKISDVIANKFQKTKPKPVQGARFVKQNIQKWSIDIRTRRNSDGASSTTSCPRHSPAAQNRDRKVPVRQRSYSSSKQEPEDEVTKSGRAGRMTRGLSEVDLQKLNKISNLFEAFKCPIDVVAGKRPDVMKRIKNKSGDSVPLCRLMDGVEEDAEVHDPCAMLPTLPSD